MNLTKYGVTKEPTNKIASASPNATKKLLKGGKKLMNFMKINIGKTVSATKINLPVAVILCFLPQLSHSIGLYPFQLQNDLYISLQLNGILQFWHFCKIDTSLYSAIRPVCLNQITIISHSN
nr:hypothetical protein [Lentibacillus daqui]